MVITKKLRAARLKLTTEWLAAEREHPILAAYRGGKIDELEDVALGKADASDDDRMRATLARVIPKLVNIRKALNYLDKGYVSPVEIARAVALARRDLLIPPGSKWNPLCSTRSPRRRTRAPRRGSSSCSCSPPSSRWWARRWRASTR